MSADGVSEDALLGGRLRLKQPRRGHRFGHDAVLLAAACPAQPGECVVDLGAGVGAAGLALAARVPDLVITLVEIDPELARLAVDNAKLNGLSERVRVIALDVAAPARAFEAAGLFSESAARVLMNPPFNDPLRQRASPDPRRRLAYAGSPASLGSWIKCATRLLRPRGTLTLIWRADGLDEVLGALAHGYGGVSVLPVHPTPREPAIRVLVSASKASRAPLAVLPGLVLQDGAGAPTSAAEAVLRGTCDLLLAAVKSET